MKVYPAGGRAQFGALALAALFTAVAWLAISAVAAEAAPTTKTAEIQNFDRGAPVLPPTELHPRGYPHGAQIVKLDEEGNAMDAHADYLTWFEGKYYLYGESFGCTYDYQPASFCGFRVYESEDLVHWKSRGRILDPQVDQFAKETCQTTISCWGPNVVYNKATDKYMLWFYRAIGQGNTTRLNVMQSDSPLGPWENVGPPSNFPSCHCVFNIFQEADGSAYISYTTGSFGLRVQQLNATYTDAIGTPVTVTEPSGSIVAPACQAPGGLTGPEFVYQTPVLREAWKRCGVAEQTTIIRKDDRYYLVFGDPICAFCLGTSTAYFVADDPLGPWTGVDGSPSYDPERLGQFEPFVISEDSCGGQPFHTASLPSPKGTVYLHTSVLWSNSKTNGAANHYWEPLRFKHGEIEPLRCNNPEVPLAQPAPKRPEPPRALNICAAGSENSLAQTLVAPATGTTGSVFVSLYKRTRPSRVFGAEGLVSEPLTVRLINARTGKMATRTLQPAELSWAPTRYELPLAVAVRAKDPLLISFESASPEGCYATLFEAHNPYRDGSLNGEGGIPEPAVQTADLADRHSDLLFAATVNKTNGGQVQFGSWELGG